ncbi:FadR/GntR family transcriptional regulator [Brachybacterium sp. AOP29-B2-41]|uniref:FadR/GntR family transcriptional regulator n=1 Tax=Brachybacterium sp. AOP29-B2-41 TaxID=3457704 RepID=UPI00403407E3
MTARVTAFERALDQLGREIVDGELPAGHADTVDGLVVRTGASRSVVREVTRVLTSLGMLSAGRRVGLRVLAPEHWDTLDAQVVRWRLVGPDAAAQLTELRALRLAIEPAAAADAARAVGERPVAALAGREALTALEQAAAVMQAAASASDPAEFLAADRALHTAVLSLSGNAMFIRLGAVIEEGLRDRALRERAGLPPEAHDLALHLEVARAVAAGEPAAAEAAMREIIERTHP